MEETTLLSPQITQILNVLGLGLSILLLFVVAYLFLANGRKSNEIAHLQAELVRLRKDLGNLKETVEHMWKPRVVDTVPQVEPFGLDFSESAASSPLAPQKPWLDFVENYNQLAAEMATPGQLKKCEKFVYDFKLRVLTYGGAMTFRPAIDVKDSRYWAFKCSSDEFAVVPNPMHPCDEDFHENGGMKETYALNYQDGVYRKYFVKLPAIFTYEPAGGWQLKNTGVVNLERN